MLVFELFWMFMATVKPANIRIEAKLINDDLHTLGGKDTDKGK
jgi:hypothetical protein